MSTAVPNTAANLEILNKLQPGMKVRVVSRLYGTRVLTITKAAEPSESVPDFIYVYTTSGKTLKENFRGGMFRYQTQDHQLLFQPTYTQQICEVISLEIV